MYIPRFRRARIWYTQLEVSTQIGDIAKMTELRNNAKNTERAEYDNQIEIAQYVLTRMLERNEKKLKREV